ncbi:MAG: hypothetical protein ISR65_07400 [Bacteriovoracaceae bacterium]|nr:hypothetical protein [Bacteriovoracaceae bacterium]
MKLAAYFTICIYFFLIAFTVIANEEYAQFSKGFTGATATLMINGSSVDSYQYNDRSRNTIKLDAGSKKSSSFEIRFGDIDPKVYSFEVQVLVAKKKKTKIVKKYRHTIVTKSMRQVYQSTEKLMAVMNELLNSRQYLTDSQVEFLNTVDVKIIDLHVSSSAAIDSDIGRDVGVDVDELLQSTYCKNGESVMRNLTRSSSPNIRNNVISLRKEIAALVEKRNFFNVCDDK